MAIEIDSIEKLIAFSQGEYGRGTSSEYLDAVLTKDLDFSEYSDEIYSWPGCAGTWYMNFDGQGHKVDNIYYSGSAGFGFFGIVYGTVKNLKLTNLYALSTENAQGLAYEVHGSIENVIVTGEIMAGKYASGIVTTGYPTLTACCFSGKVTSTGDRAGGLSALNSGQVFSCSAIADITSRNSYAFGLVNTNGGIYNSFFRGSLNGAFRYALGDGGGVLCYSTITQANGNIIGSQVFNTYYDATLAAAGGFSVSNMTAATTEELKSQEWLRAHYFAM